ncbi:MAG: AsmA-like C-terminal domain-containing protein, partial [Rhizobiales bacterium]|nr:AsmA-like C-terminal domain-containing protein [Hyphomicrobiales bacterium]
RVVVDDRGMRDATLNLDVGAGVLDFGTPDEAVLLDEASFHARWDGAAGEIVVEPSSLHFGPTSGSFTGVIRDEGSGRMMFAFESGDATLAARDTGEPPLAVQQLEIAGSTDIASRVLDVDRVVIQTEDGTFAGAFRLGFTGETPSLSAAAELTPMDIATWKRMWPPFLAPGARRWALDNIAGGRIASARFEAAVPAGELFRTEPPSIEKDALRLDLRLEDVTVSTIGGLPPITRGSGHAVLAGPTFGFDIDGGELVTPSGAVVRLTDGAFAIEDVFAPVAEGMVEAQASGTARALGELADAEPFRALGRRDLTPADLSGKGDATVSVRVPLVEKTDVEADWKVTVRGQGLGSAKPIDGRVFRNGDLTIEVTPAGVAVNGSAEIDGVMAAVSLAQPLAEDGSDGPGSQQAASLVLDREARLRLGLDIEDIVSGTIGAQVTSLPGGSAQHYELDLTRARLVLPGVGWAKEAGVPATMRFDLRPAGDGSRAERIVFEGKGFGFTGSAGKAYKIGAKGASFDIRGVIAEMKDAGDAAGGDEDSVDIALDAQVGKLRGYGGRAITDAAVSFSLVDDVPRKLTVNGKLAGSALSLAYVDELARASLAATSGNAGAVFQYLDIYERIGGGRLSITGERPAATGPLAGIVSMTDFAILDEPAMREVVSRSKPRETEQIDTKKMHVDEMSTVFRYTGDELFVDDAFLRGSAMGATFQGFFDLARSSMAINGTYIPLFGINNAFSRVPVVGKLLGGKAGEGLIGVTFKVEGPIDAPRLFINPLSAVAPGIFRKIFEFR